MSLKFNFADPIAAMQIRKLRDKCLLEMQTMTKPLRHDQLELAITVGVVSQLMVDTIIAMVVLTGEMKEECLSFLDRHVLTIAEDRGRWPAELRKHWKPRPSPLEQFKQQQEEEVK